MSRVSRTLAVALCALALLWALALLALAHSARNIPFPAHEPVDLRVSAQPGINLERNELAPDSLRTMLETLAQAGVRWVRFTLPWDDIEPHRGAYSWGEWDRVFASLALHPDITPIVVIDRSPVWARAEGDRTNPLAPPHERADFGTFARRVAERYGGQVRYYQVWHEPNIAPHWGSRPADPADYLGLLREAAVQLRSSDGDARIVAAALAPTTEGGPANLSDLVFLDRLYALGGRIWFDYPAVQPYGFSSAPDAPANATNLNFGRAEAVREIMVRHGDGATELWATAFGWHTTTDQASPWGSVSAEEQSVYTAAAYAKAATEWSWLGPMLWTGNFPPTAATREALFAAAKSPAQLSAGSHRPDHPALRYSSGWRITPAAADPSADGDTLDFAFHGTGVALQVQRGPYWAYLTASIDGGAANRLPRDESGASYLVLHDPGSTTQLAPLATGLTPGLHTVRLISTGGWGQWALQGIVVSATPAPSPWPARGLLAAALLATIAFVVAVRQGGSPGRVWGGTLSRGAARAKATLLAFVERAAALPQWMAWCAAIVLIAVFLVSGSGLVNLALLVLLGLLFILQPAMALPLIAASLPLWQRTEPVLRWQFGLFELLAWLGLAALLARRLFDRLRGLPRTLPRPGPLDAAVLGLFLSGTLSTLFAAEQGVAWREWRMVFLFGLVVYFLFRVSAADAGRRRSVARFVVVGLLAGSAIVSLIALFQLVTGLGRVDVEGVMRVRALYGSPNNLALVLDRAVPLALALAAFGLARRGRVLYGLVAALTLIACLVTFSKGALLLGLPAGIAVVLIGGAWRKRQRWPLGVLGAALVVALVGLVFLFRTPRFADLFNYQAGTSFFRVKLWQGALNMALDHPLLGVGPDNFLYAYRTRYVLPSAWQELNLSHPHNIALDLWTRLGLIGVVAGVWALIAGLRAGWRLFRDAGEATWPLALGLLAGLVVTVVHGLIDNSLFLPDLMGWFVLQLGLFAIMRENGTG